MDRIRVSLLGSTGMVGQKMLTLLKNHPYIDVVNLSASKAKKHFKYRDAVNWVEHGDIPEKYRDMELVSTDPEDHKNVDYVLSALPPEAAEETEINLIKNGINVISNASPYRMDENIPLINPELNYDHLNLLKNRDIKFVKNPNCTSTIMSMPLNEILKLDYKKITLTTLQAISGAGYTGLPYMGIDDNIIPYIPGEEEKIPREISKMFGFANNERIINRNLNMFVTSVRVPVKVGHMGIMNVELNEDIDLEKFKNNLKAFNPLKGFKNLYNAPEKPIILHEEENRPQNMIDLNNGMEIHMGRFDYHDHNLRFIVLGDNLIRGAAGITILTLETMKEMSLL